MNLTVWNKTTGIKAPRVFDFSVDTFDRDKWLAVRRSGIGGSDISAIVGVNPFKSAIDVFLEKKGKIVVEENNKMKWGKILEPDVATEFSAHTGAKVHRCNAVLASPDCPYFLANIDRLILKPADQEFLCNPTIDFLNEYGNGILEIKTTSWAKAWEGGDIPPMYMCQLQWYLMVTGLRWGQFAVLVSGSDFFVSDPIPYSPDVCKSLVYSAHRFWSDCILKDSVPEPDQNPKTLESMKILFPEVKAESVTLPDSLNDLLGKRKDLVTLIKQAESQKAAIDSKVLFEMRDHKWAFTSQWQITRVQRNSMQFDKKRFQEEHPEVYRDYLKGSSSVYPLYSPIK